MPTLIEKPLATDTVSSARLVEAFESAGLVNAVGHIERCNPALRSLRERLANGELGEVYQVATRRQGPFPNRIADVGVVKDLATHDIDLTRWVIQSPYATVSAQTSHRSGREHEDLISVTARMADETVVSHLVNWLSPMKERLTVVTGDRGAFVGRHPARRPDVPRERRGAGRVGPGHDVPWRERGQHDAVRHPQARAPARSARELP